MSSCVNVVAELNLYDLVALRNRFANRTDAVDKTFHVIKRVYTVTLFARLYFFVFFAVANFDVFGTTKYVPDVENIQVLL